MKRTEQSGKQKPKRELIDAFTARLYLGVLAVWFVVMAAVTALYTVDIALEAYDSAWANTVGLDWGYGELSDQQSQRAVELYNCASAQVEFSGGRWWSPFNSWYTREWWEWLFVPQLPSEMTGAVHTKVYSADRELLWDSEGPYAAAVMEEEGTGISTWRRVVFETETGMPTGPLSFGSTAFIEDIYGVMDGDLLRVKGYTLSFWEDDMEMDPIGEPMTEDMVRLTVDAVRQANTYWQNGSDDDSDTWGNAIRPVAWDRRSAEPLEDTMERFLSEQDEWSYVVRDSSWNLWQVTYLALRPYTLESTGETVYLLMGGRCFPLLAVLGYLRWFYLGTLILALVAASRLRRWLWQQAAYPIQRVNSAAEYGLRPIPYWKGEEYQTTDINALLNHYQATAERGERLAGENAALERKAKFAQEAEEQRRMMTSGLAHELKTPLAIVHSYAEGLQEHIAEEKREEYLNVILSESERMDGIIQDMLALSRLESGRAKLERTEVSLGELAERCFQPLTRAMEEKHLTFVSELNPKVIVSADETRLGQVITNFASNAVRYTPEGGTITLRVGYALGGAQCSVENTCPPIPEEILSRVWEPFFRGTKSRTERSSGLGLTIARSIVELHGGKVAAERTKDGVKFSFTL